MPRAVTRSSTPSSGHAASGTSPTVISPGPCQIAARNVPSVRRPIASSARYHSEVVVQLGGPVIEFIFMLTRDDKTLPDAREVYASIADTGVRHVGCKDVGLPREELAALMDDIRGNGHTSHLEVVSESEEATL